MPNISHYPAAAFTHACLSSDPLSRAGELTYVDYHDGKRDLVWCMGWRAVWLAPSAAYILTSTPLRSVLAACPAPPYRDILLIGTGDWALLDKAVRKFEPLGKGKKPPKKDKNNKDLQPGPGEALWPPLARPVHDHCELRGPCGCSMSLRPNNLHVPGSRRAIGTL